MKIIFFIPAAVFLYVACSPSYWVGVDRCMQDVKLGMTKAEITQTVGTDYKIASAYKDENGNTIEVLSYRNQSSEEYYLKLVNDKLIEWNKEQIYQYKIENTSKSEN
jgi:7-cyano-7-deazaguanine synthase in queuosine biosynthesis